MMSFPDFSLSSLQGLAPALIPLLGAILVLALDIPLRQQKEKGTLAIVAALSLLLALGSLALNWHQSLADPFPGMFKADALSMVADLALLLIGLMTLLLSHRIAPKLGLAFGEYYALLLFAVAGMMLFAASNNLILAFVALETFSLAMYVLAGFDRRNRMNREAALKYFLMGALAAAFLLFGIAIIYGTSGTINLDELKTAAAGITGGPALTLSVHEGLLLAGVAMSLVGLGFKLGLAPFHLWAPDTYEGAPTPVSAFLSAGAKVAAFTLLLRLIGAVAPLSSAAMLLLLSTLAVLTMLLGNMGALRQTNLKRLMAYSSIAHSGYALVGLVGGSPLAPAAVMNYVFVYAFMNFCTFALLIAIEQEKPDAAAATLDDIQGIGFEKPFFGILMAVCMFSMAGIPPTAGFVAKLDVFRAALDAKQSSLVVLAVLNSVVSAAVYLRVLVYLYMKPKLKNASNPALGGWLLGGSLVCGALLLIWGLLPGTLFNLTSF